MFKTDQAKGLVLTTLGALAIVPDSLFVRLIGAEALVVAFWRALFVGLGITLVILVMRGPSAFRAVFGTGFYGALYTVCMSASGLLFVLAVSLTSVANVVFIIASMPVFAAIFSRIILGEQISRRMVWTILAVVPGLAIIAYGSGETKGASVTGDLLALLVSAVYALGLTAARKVRKVPMVPAVGLGYLASAGGIMLFVDPFVVSHQQVSLSLAHAAFIGLSATFLALGPRYIPSAEVALLLLLESVLAPLLMWVAMGEVPGGWTLTGGAVVLGALALSNWSAMRASRRRPVGPLPH